MFEKTTICVAKGDGIGPEIMNAVLQIFDRAQVPLHYQFVDMGKSVYDKGFNSGMTDEAKTHIEKFGLLFKGPMETPKGGGVKSINVTARKTWNTHSNIRTFETIPGVETIFSKAGLDINITVVRENIEDTYGGIEHFVSNDVAVSKRIISKPGSQQVIRTAFETAKKQGIKKIHCGHKANIMKQTDGLFLKTFYEIAKDYPEIEAKDIIVDALCMQLVRFPQDFDMIVLTNLQGDIVSDLCAGLVGGLGFAPSANVGDQIMIFEAVHGTAPDIAGKNLANPTSLLLSGVAMLRQLGLQAHASLIYKALRHTIDSGAHTGDFGTENSPNLSTSAYTKAIVNTIDIMKNQFDLNQQATYTHKIPSQNKMLITNSEGLTEEGIDVFIQSDELPEGIAKKIHGLISTKITLLCITNRGTLVWPQGSVFTDLVNSYCLRFSKNQKDVDLLSEILELQSAFEISSTEKLYKNGDQRAYSLAQGQ